MSIPLPITSPEARKFFKELLQAQYLSRFIKFPPQYLLAPGPLPPRPGGEPQPQPSHMLRESVQQSLIGELFIHALAEITPETNRLSIINDIKKEQLDREVVEELIGEFENGIQALKKELTAIKKCQS